MAFKKTTKPKEVDLTTEVIEGKSSKNGELIKRIQTLSTFNRQVKVLKSGLISLDMLAAGEIDYTNECGFFSGKLYGFTGDSGIGKSTLNADLINKFCLNGHRGIICDYEEGFNKKSVVDFGLAEFIAFGEDIEQFINCEKSLLVINPVTYGDTASILFDIIDKNKVKVDFVLFDSIKKIQSQFTGENVENIEKLPMGMRARKLGDLLPFIKTLFGKYNICGFFINHQSVKMNQYGGFDAESSNKAYLENMDARFMIKRKKDGMLYRKVVDQNNESVEKEIGNWIEISSTKSRVGNTVPLYIPILFGKGVSIIYQYMNLLLVNNIAKGGERSNSKIDLAYMKGDMDALGIDGSMLPEYVSGESGLRELVKTNIDAVENYLIKKGCFSIEKS